MATDRVLVGLNIGTTMTRVAIGEFNADGNLEIIGVGSSKSGGLKRGVVVNIESTLRSIAEAVERAEQMAGCEVREMYVGIAGNHIEGFNSRGVVAVTGKGREINRHDIERVIEAARAVAIPMDREVLHVIPHEFIVDSQGGIRDPIDIIGVRLEAEVHVVTGSVTSARNLVRCVNRAGFQVESLVLESLAAAKAVLTKDERDLGALLIDIGGETTNVLLYHDNAPYFTLNLPIGGAQVTTDLSIMLKTPLSMAEQLKLDAGSCGSIFADDEESVIIPGVGGRPPLAVKRTELASIVQPRMAEIFRMVRKRLDQNDYLRYVGGGIVLTGGGALLPGSAELAQEIFQSAVRVGQPGTHGGVVDAYRRADCSTVVGLVLYAEELYRGSNMVPAANLRHSSGMLHGLKKLFRSFFE